MKHLDNEIDFSDILPNKEYKPETNLMTVVGFVLMILAVALIGMIIYAI